MAAPVARLDAQHTGGAAAVRELQHLLLGWELLGEPRHEAFAQALEQYVAFSTEHIQREEAELLPVAQALLAPQKWRAIDIAFASNRDPLGPQGVPRDPTYDRLFTASPWRVAGLVRLG